MEIQQAKDKLKPLNPQTRQFMSQQDLDQAVNPMTDEEVKEAAKLQEATQEDLSNWAEAFLHQTAN